MKKSVLWLLLDLVFLVIFNILFFMLKPDVVVATVWISYGFIHFAYLMLLITPLLTHTSGNRSVMGFPLYYIGSIYFLLTLAFGVFFMLLGSKNWKLVLGILIVLTGFYLAMLLIVMIKNAETEETEEKRVKEVSFVKKIASEVKDVLNQVDFADDKKRVESLYDDICASPTKSDLTVQPIEREIDEHVEMLRDIVRKGDSDLLCSQVEFIRGRLDERNRQLRLLN